MGIPGLNTDERYNSGRLSGRDRLFFSTSLESGPRQVCRFDTRHFQIYLDEDGKGIDKATLHANSSRQSPEHPEVAAYRLKR